MSDIVERLRDLVVETKHGKGVRASIAAEDVLEAADEIERLRKEVARLVKSRNKWGQKYNQTLEKLKLAVWTDTEEVKAANEAANAAVVARDEAIREVSRLGRELGTTQARLAEAVEVLKIAEAFINQLSPAGQTAKTVRAFLAKRELKELTVGMSDEEMLTSLFGAKVEHSTTDEALVERVARAIYPHVFANSDYDEVPFAEAMSRPRYAFLKEQVLRAALAAIRAMEEKP